MKERQILFSAPILSAFEAKYTPEPNTGCWLWIGALTETGYGRFRGTTAQRAAHLLLKGEISDGFTVDHLCRVRSCVNPSHLEAVPHRVNLRRGIAARETGACRAGHDRATFGCTRDGKKKCRECDRLRNLRLYKKTSSRRRYRWLMGEQKARVMALVANGQSHSQIAIETGLSIATISRVRNSNA